MNHLEDIKAIFAAAIGDEAAANVSGDATMETVPGWDSLSFLAVVHELEIRFGLNIKPSDAASLFSVAGISRFLDRHLKTNG